MRTAATTGAPSPISAVVSWSGCPMSRRRSSGRSEQRTMHLNAVRVRLNRSRSSRARSPIWRSGFRARSRAEPSTASSLDGRAQRARRTRVMFDFELFTPSVGGRGVAGTFDLGSDRVAMNDAASILDTLSRRSHHHVGRDDFRDPKAPPDRGEAAIHPPRPSATQGCGLGGGNARECARRSRR